MAVSDPRDKDPKQEDSEDFIEDLRSIKDLLDEHDADRAVQPDDEDNVPLLDDQIEEALSEHMGDETFETLLSDTWRDSVEAMFEDARARIEANSAAWLPEHTDELSAALKVRIDASVRAWLAETLAANIGRLRERIVQELSAEILTHMRSKLGQHDKEGGSDHG